MNSIDKINVSSIIQQRKMKFTSNENKPLSVEEVSALAHIPGRKVKQYVQELRLEGARIGGDDDGYFWAVNPSELMGARNIILAHIRSRQETIKALEQTMERMKHDKMQDNLF